MLVDTHAHLYWDSFKDDLDQVIQRSIDAGVTTIINVGVDVEKSKVALEQVQGKLSKIPGLSAYSTIGIHPHEAYRYINSPDVSIHEDIVKLEEIYQSGSDKIVAIGECGLDYYFESAQFYPGISITPPQAKTLQKKLFQAQIDLAKKLNLPLIVHCRDDRFKDPDNSECWDEILNMVYNHPTILHCYSGLPKTTAQVIKKSNLIVSFAGTITYPKNEYLREAAKLLPMEQIVLETDCPFLPPQSIRGQRNEPSSVLEIAKLVADIKETSLAEIVQQTTDNAVKILRLRSG